jgi:hypothetical protein
MKTLSELYDQGIHSHRRMPEKKSHLRDFIPIMSEMEYEIEQSLIVLNNIIKKTKDEQKYS